MSKQTEIDKIVFALEQHDIETDGNTVQTSEWYRKTAESLFRAGVRTKTGFEMSLIPMEKDPSQLTVGISPIKYRETWADGSMCED